MSSIGGGGRGSGGGGVGGIAANTNSSLASISTGATTHRGSMVRMHGTAEGNGDSQVCGGGVIVFFFGGGTGVRFGFRFGL